MTSCPAGHQRSSVHRRRRRRALGAAGGLAASLLLVLNVRGDSTYHVLSLGPFTQNWSNTGLITTDDNWAGVPSITGYRGDNLTAATGADPQTILAPGIDPGDSPAGVVDVNANRSDPNVFATGGATEFDGIANPVVALAGSGTADAPFLLLNLDTTGQSGIQVSYNLRDIDGSIDNAVQQVALQYRVGPSGNFTNLPAGYVADATSGPSLATLVTPVSVTLPAACENQPQVQLRIITTNAAGNDEWVGIDDISVTSGTPPATTLSINDVSLAEGNVGTQTATFTVSLSAPAGLGGVTFDIATSDNTATLADNDYVANSLLAQTIPQGSQTYQFDVTINGDVTVEPNESFFVNITNVVGAAVTDGQGVGTIVNDDVVLTPIHDIQGPGASSPLSGVVSTTGIVTGLKSNGFFIQEPDASVDADPATSEGIFVFTSSAPPVSAAIGNLVQVTGTISEFVPTADPQQPPLTELTSPSVLELSSGNPLPAPVPLTAAFPDPSGVFDQLERLEGMRVSVASLTVVGGTLGNVNEPNATATTTGVFFGTVTGVARPFREPGIQAPDTAPSGTIPPIPRFDTNPETIRVDSDGQAGGVAIDVAAGTEVTGLVGPLDYTFRRYTILPDPATPPGVTGGASGTPVAVATSSEFTVASFNLQRFFDTVNDPGIGEPVLTATAFDNRLNKASLAIRNFLRAPDIIGVQEVENLSTLETLATRINGDALSAAQPDPQYVAYLEEGNDVGGIDVGFLVKTALVSGSTPRVTVNAVVQENKNEQFVNPNLTTELLNDRPSLRLDATVHSAVFGSSFPVTVIVNHLRSLNGVDSNAAGSNGWATEGDRVRAKRQKQAESLANLVQARQTADPAERIVLVGDFNAFAFNDGYGDSIGVIRGVPSPDNETVVPGDGVDLVNPDVIDLSGAAPASDRYSYVFDGNAQTLDHVLINSALAGAASAERAEHARINADFPEVARNTASNALRLSDHDPVVAYFDVPGFVPPPDLAIFKTDGQPTAFAGQPITYTILAQNLGPSGAVGATVNDVVPAAITGATWTCVGAGGGTCTAAGAGNISDTVNLPVGASVTYSLTGTVSPSATGTLYNLASISAPVGVIDPDLSNNGSTDTDTIIPPPTVVTGAATLVGELSATLNGTVNPNGGSTQAYFEYGTTTSYGNTSPSQDVGSGTSDVPVSQYVSGLACATTYHFRAVGVNASGTTPGGDLTFMTTACKPSRVFVSVLGLDTNDCSNIATPCRTLNAAITQVAEDGEVIVVKSGSYAGATITKGVKIDAASGVVAFSGQPVTVNAPSAKVVIRGLTLKAVTPGTGDGILIQDAGAVFVENTVIDGWDTAIYGQATELFIKDSTIRNNGIGIWPFSGKITIDTSRFTNNSTGIRASMATGIATLALRGSTLSGNFLGIDNDSPSVITVEKCQIANNHVGMSLQPGSMGVLRLSHSAVTGNDFGLVNAGGTLYVYGNNAVRGNTIDTSGTITPAGLQ